MKQEPTLLRGRALWNRITKLVRKAKHTEAAVSYLGKGGYSMLPLRKGDVLVVDMSTRSVKQGVTNPFEIEKYMNNRGMGSEPYN